MTIYLTNTLSNRKEVLRPIDPENATMYVCGPTVYDRPHIGNARPTVVFDVLFRLLQKNYPRVTYVRNITDVDDKIEAAAASLQVPIHTITEQTTAWFHEDLAALNVLPPTHEPRATQHIDGMISMIQTLIQKGFAYEAEGHVLFSVQKFPSYGQLSKQSPDAMCAGARVEVAPYKEYAGDFVLWKPSTPQQSGWQSPWGRGRPGWHIECSAMSQAYLGQTFDIHGGGVDLVFPHHENEIAQSCAAHGTSHMANIWMHNGPLTWQGEKMSKSLGNVVLLHDLLATLPGEVVRLGLLGVHYRQPHHWTPEHVEQATLLQRRLQAILSEHPPTMGDCTEVEDALKNDLNTPLALSHLHAYIKQGRYAEVSHAAWLLGLRPSAVVECVLSPEAQSFLDDRAKARAERQWTESDRLRDALLALGVQVSDSPSGTTWSWIEGK